MSKQANSLQESLERLEAGESLESSQQNLSAEEQPSLSLASRLRAADWPHRDPKIVAEQRAQIVTQYRQEAKIGSEDQTRSGFFKVWRLPVALSAVVVLLMVCGLVAVSAIGILWFNSQRVSLSPLPNGDVTRQAVSEGGIELTTEPSDLTAQPAGSTTESPASMVPSNQAMLSDFHGLVEIQTDETWQVVSEDTVLTSGSRLHTASFSSVLLTFSDGSFAQIGPDSEISVEKLAVDLANGTREISLMQWSGESTHTVVPFDSAAPNYRVDTPSASGQVKGTQFRVQVVPDQTVWMVDDGAVEVSGNGASVQIGAGEMTSVVVDESPADPVEFITGQGEVDSIGDVWVINEQPYQIHAKTIIIGNPQISDLVFYEGHLETENRVADQIVLIRRNPANTFTLAGVIESGSKTKWVINGQEILITEKTVLDNGIREGSLVRVKGIVLADGKLQAEEILLISEEAKIPFEFTGVVQEIDGQNWLISGKNVLVDERTVHDPGLGQSDKVQVKGLILDDGTWWASSIVPFLDENSAFEFVGKLEGKNPWVVAGVELETREWTAIDELEVGEMVQVSGQIQPDGTWLAFEIRRYDQALLTILVGRVFNIDPWVVSGVQLNVDAETIIEGPIELNMLVRVELQLLPDGSHRVIRITPFDGFDWDMSCQSVVVTVTSIDGNQIVLDGWPALPISDDTQIEGDLKPGSVVQTMICYDEDDNVVLVYITVLENPELPQPPDDDYVDNKDEDKDVDGDHKITICHKPGKLNFTISIDASAWPAHKAHGDILGPCP